MQLSTQAQAFEARKNWMARLVRARIAKLTCNIGPPPDQQAFPPQNRHWGHTRAMIDHDLPDLPGAWISRG